MPPFEERFIWQFKIRFVVIIIVSKKMSYFFFLILKKEKKEFDKRCNYLAEIGRGGPIDLFTIYS